MSGNICILLLVSVQLINATPKVWRNEAQSTLEEALKIKQNHGVAKNVILFVGDGMGVSTVTAARIYKGQKAGKTGEETVLSFENFPNLALSKTYNVDHQVPDSAGTATAMLCGVKTDYGAIGVTENSNLFECSSLHGNEAESILMWSQKKGKSTGIVTTTRITHATPASAYAHIPCRKWEVDWMVPQEESCGDIMDIAAQLVTNNKDINVILGGGRSYLMPNSTASPDPEYPEYSGLRRDGRNLIQEWSEDKTSRGSRHSYVWNEEDFSRVDPENTDHLLGLFDMDHMQFELDRPYDMAGEPPLADMVEKAIKILDNNDRGYFLLAEGGRIDHAHHKGNAKRSLEDTIAFDEAVKRALELTSEEDTLIVVTADHSHTFTIGGYPSRGNDILGFYDEGALFFQPPLDGLPATVLMYANGPGPTNRSELIGQDPTEDDFKQPVAVPMKDETHGGEEVAIYARGPMSHLFHGVHEQNYIAHVMAYASCVGDNKGHCKGQRQFPASSANITKAVYSVMFILCMMFSSLHI